MAAEDGFAADHAGFGRAVAVALVTAVALLVSAVALTVLPEQAMASVEYTTYVTYGEEVVGGAKYEICCAEDEWEEHKYWYASYNGPVNKRKSTYTIPKSVKVKIDGRTRKIPVKKIGRMAFKGCKRVKTVNCKASVEVIEGRAFYKCTKLKTFKSNAPIAHIEKQAFAGCVNLTTFRSRADRLHSIEESAFNRCVKLKSIPRLAIASKAHAAFCFHQGEINVEKRAFRDCKKLKKIAFNLSGGSRKNIVREVYVREEAFRGCEKLTKISFDGMKPNWQHWNIDFDSRSFKGCKKLSSFAGLGKLDSVSVYASAFNGVSVPIRINEHGWRELYDRETKEWYYLDWYDD